jgi:hypothetical protein
MGLSKSTPLFRAHTVEIAREFVLTVAVLAFCCPGFLDERKSHLPMDKKYFEGVMIPLI